MSEITHKINDYLSIVAQDAGKPYDFTGKDGKQVKGVSKETIKIVTPYGSTKLKPNELLGIWGAQKDKALYDEVVRRSKL